MNYKQNIYLENIMTFVLNLKIKLRKRISLKAHCLAKKLVHTSLLHLLHLLNLLQEIKTILQMLHQKIEVQEITLQAQRHLVQSLLVQDIQVQDIHPAHLILQRIHVQVVVIHTIEVEVIRMDKKIKTEISLAVQIIIIIIEEAEIDQKDSYKNNKIIFKNVNKLLKLLLTLIIKNLLKIK